MGNTLAIVVGGTNIWVALVTQGSTEPMHVDRLDTGRPQESMTASELEKLWLHDVRRIKRIAKRLQERYGFVRIGLTLAGQVEEGVVILCGNILHWQGRDAGAYFQEVLGIMPVVQNDAVADALAQAVHGPIKEPFRFWVHGTGAGSCLVWRDDTGRLVWRAEEPGHDPALAEYLALAMVPKQHVTGVCGVADCLESFICEWGIGERYGRDPRTMSDQDWEQIVGDPLCEGVAYWQDESQTPHIVFGGSVPFRRGVYVTTVRMGLTAMLGDKTPQVHQAALGESSGLVGAAVVAELADQSA